MIRRKQPCLRRTWGAAAVGIGVPGPGACKDRAQWEEAAARESPPAPGWPDLPGAWGKLLCREPKLSRH